MGRELRGHDNNPPPKLFERPVTAAVTGAENIRWDLTDLHADGESALQAMKGAEERARALRNAHRRKVHTLDAEALAGVLEELDTLLDQAGGAYTYAYLNWSTDTRDASRGALLQKIKEQYARVQQQLKFFDVEWVHVEEDRAQMLLRDEALAPYRHHLERERRYADYVLTEREETVVVTMDITGRSAWVRYFQETMGALQFELDGEPLSQPLILAKLHESDRPLRQRAARAFTEGLKAKQHSLTYIFNVLLGDKHRRDYMRGYGHWLQSRNLDNEVSDEIVDALVSSVTQRYDLVARHYQP